MIRIRRLSVIALSVVVLVGGLVMAAPEMKSIEEIVREHIQPLVDQSLPLKQRYIGIWVGVISNSKEFMQGFGERTLGAKNPPDEQTFFEIGSISKTFTGISLADSGLDLNAKAQDFLPKNAVLPTYNESSITLLQLVTHTAALPSIAADIDSLQKFLEYTPANAYSFLKTYKLARVPGFKYDYSNLSFGLLAHILEKSPEDEETVHFENLVAKITSPLGMTETVVFLNAEQKLRLSRAYDDDGNSDAYWKWGINSINSGAGALKSTGFDMMKYLRANLGLTLSSVGRAIEKSHVELFKVDESLSIGYGWHILNLGNERVVWHNGGTGGFQTFVGFNKVKKTGVILLANTAHKTEDSRVDPRIDQAAFGILRNLCSAGVDFSTLKPTITSRLRP